MANYLFSSRFRPRHNFWKRYLELVPQMGTLQKNLILPLSGQVFTWRLKAKVYSHLFTNLAPLWYLLWGLQISLQSDLLRMCFCIVQCSWLRSIPCNWGIVWNLSLLRLVSVCTLLPRALQYNLTWRALFLLEIWSPHAPQKLSGALSQLFWWFVRFCLCLKVLWLSSNVKNFCWGLWLL